MFWTWNHCDKREKFSSWAIFPFVRIQNLYAADASNYMWERVNPFPHTTILQQTTLNVFCQNIENLYNWMDNLWPKVKNIVAKGEIARFVQFLLLSLCFKKAVCSRGVRKRLYEEKVYLMKNKLSSFFRIGCIEFTCKKIRKNLTIDQPGFEIEQTETSGKSRNYPS